MRIQAWRQRGIAMKYCINCGKELPDDALFCADCGIKQPDPSNIGEEFISKDGPVAVPPGTDEIIEASAEDASPKAKQGRRYESATDGSDPYVSKNVLLCPDGKYRWVYEKNLFKDFSILFLIWKVFAGVIIGMGLLFFIIELFDSHNYGFVLQMVGIMFGIFFVLSILGYLIYAAVMGGKY